MPAPPREVPEDTLAVPDEIDGRFEALVEDELAGDPTELLELLTALRENPLDVNAATAEELAQIPAFTPALAAAVVRYRERNGPFPSLPLLQQVEGVTPDVYLDARPYLAAGPPLAGPVRVAARFPAAPTAREVVGGLRYSGIQRVQRRLDTPAGYLGPDSLRVYPGSPARVYTRLQATYRRQVSVNVTLEKDPGEPFRFDGGTNTYGYDYVSAHAAVLDAGRIDALVVGDYVAEFGQGVALWRASGFGKGPDAVQGPVRSGRGLRPYGSVDENNFLRGTALTVAAHPNLYVSAFASRRALDASVLAPDSADVFDPDLPPGALTGQVVTSLAADGLHRTDRELARKDALDETLVGGGVEGRLSTGRVQGRAGVVATRSRFGAPLGAGTRPDELFDFVGSEATVVSVYADAKARAAGHAFGEVVCAGGRAASAAWPASGPTWAAARTSSSSGATTPRTSRASTGTRSASGTGSGGTRPGSTSAPASARRRRGPWTPTSTSIGSRSSGSTCRARVGAWRRSAAWSTGRAGTSGRTSRPGRRRAKSAWTWRMRSPARQSAGSPTRRARRSGSTASGDASRSLRLRARVEGSRYAEAGEPTQTGSLVYQDVRWQALGWLRSDVRLTLFNTDGYDARLYAFENDLTGVFSIPALSGRGVRGYVLLTAEPVENLVAQVKLAATWFRNVRRVGSGANTVEGGRVRDLGVQVRYRF